MRTSELGTAAAAAGAVLLAALSLTHVYAAETWYPPVALTVLVVLATGPAVRAAGPAGWRRFSGGRPVPPWLGAAAVPAVPLVQLLALLCLLTGLFAPQRAFAGLLPTWSSLADLGTVFGNGSAEMQEQAVPALPLHGLVALTVVLLGLVAIAVDLVAVAGRQPALAGLGLLVVFCVPVATIKGGVGLVALVAPTAGFALLLWADQRRRLASRASGRRTALGTATLPALRIGGLALVVALTVGTVVPALAEGSFANGQGTAGGAGSVTGTSLDPVATLHGQLTRPDPVNLLRVQASVADPAYLRAVSLDQYDPRRGWTLSSLDGETSVAGNDRLAALPARETGRQVNARITVLGLSDRFLPVLSSPLKVSVANPQNWRFDPTTGTVFGRGSTSSGTYVVTAEEPRPSIALLQAAPPLPSGNPVEARYTALPPQPAAVTDLVRSLTAGAGTPYDRVRAILDYFTNPASGFVYSLSTAPGTSGDHLVDFLQNKRGYCEQFAGAMAVMVRAAGVPARVAIGYTPGSVQPGGVRLISSNDAHAWVEVYFADLGWVPFDPTPVADQRAVTLPWAPHVGTSDTAAQPGADPEAAAPTTAGASAKLDKGDQAIPTLRAAQQGATWLRPLLLSLGGVLLVLGLVAVPGLVRVRQRRRRLADGSPGALWDELTASARDLGLRLAPARTPRQAALELAEFIGGPDAPPGRPGRRRPDPAEAGIDAVRRLALAEEAASYAPPGRDAGVIRPTPSLRAARRGLLHATPLRWRLRAAVWPASLLSGAGENWAARLRTRAAAPARRRTRTV